MAQISILILQRDASAAVAAQLPEVCSTLEDISSDYEVIVVDDASCPESLAVLEEVVRQHQRLRLVKLNPACGLSAALTVGLTTATGNCVVTLPAGELSSSRLIHLLLDGLVRADLVVGRPMRQGVRKALHRLARIPRWFLLGLEVRDPECLVWAARREAISSLQLPRGMYRYLATLVAVRGFRVGEVTIPTPGRSVALSDGLANPLDLLAAWWFKRRWRQHQRIELYESDQAELSNPRSIFNIDIDRPGQMTGYESSDRQRRPA
jgi:glycosyltransferase involved in cell wall biosynthesis